jgi:single-strand DNA-binding protein
MNLTNVTIIGRLTADPRIFPTNGTKKAFTKISVAVNERRSETESVANFYDVSVFGELAESVASSLSKGQQVIVVGHLNSYQEPYTTDDGREVHRTRTGITAIAVGPDLFRQFVRVAKMASPKPSQNGATAAPAAPEAPAPEAPAADTVTVVEEEDF